MMSLDRPAIRSNIDLSGLNTLALPCVAEQLFELSSASDFPELMTWLEGKGQPLVLGGGSNLVLPPKLTRPVVRYLPDSISFVDSSDNEVLVEVDAGANWDDLVQQTVEQGCYGLENLSLIPGSVGAAPVQNIGAYGVELKNVFEYLLALDFETGELTRFDKDMCQFAYRDSIFKRRAGRYLITKVVLKLSRLPKLSLDYGDLAKLKNVSGVDATRVRAEVIRTRQAKLPDPRELPNAGSFFKNPVVSNKAKEDLLIEYPDLVFYPVSDTHSKLAAGWLIDQAGWKGGMHNGAGVHDKQALVIVNRDRATQADILLLATKIQTDIKDRFQVDLEIEPVVIKPFVI